MVVENNMTYYYDFALDFNKLIEYINNNNTAFGGIPFKLSVNILKVNVFPETSIARIHFSINDKKAIKDQKNLLTPYINEWYINLPKSLHVENPYDNVFVKSVIKNGYISVYPRLFVDEITQLELLYENVRLNQQLYYYQPLQWIVKFESNPNFTIEEEIFNKGLPFIARYEEERPIPLIRDLSNYSYFLSSKIPLSELSKKILTNPEEEMRIKKFKIDSLVLANNQKLYQLLEITVPKVKVKDIISEEISDLPMQIILKEVQLTRSLSNQFVIRNNNNYGFIIRDIAESDYHQCVQIDWNEKNECIEFTNLFYINEKQKLSRNLGISEETFDQPLFKHIMVLLKTSEGNLDRKIFHYGIRKYLNKAKINNDADWFLGLLKLDFYRFKSDDYITSIQVDKLIRYLFKDSNYSNQEIDIIKSSLFYVLKKYKESGDIEKFLLLYYQFVKVVHTNNMKANELAEIVMEL